MKLEDLQEYFNLFVIEYLPFKDRDIYQTISNYLLDYYLPQSYNYIPAEFKSAFEDYVIPVEMYDGFLLSNGFPDYIVSKLILNEKYTLIQSFMDFNRYKGTLESIRKVSDSFDDRFNIYELYINYIDTGIAYEWVFVPILVYQNLSILDTVTGTTFNFEDIINKTNYFLISKETLESLRVSNNILLPIKTNLIMLDYKGFSQHNTLIPMYTSIILNYFKDYTIILYLKDGQYKTSLKTLYKLWYYLFFKLYNVRFSEFNGAFINFNFDNSTFPFTLSDLFTIKSAYVNIDTKLDLVDYQSRYIDKFNCFLMSDSYSSEDIISAYQLDIPVSLLNYIDTRLVDKESANIILGELYNSLITWMYSLQLVYDEYKEFLQIFVAQLPLINISLKNTTSYMLIQHFKPYHVEVVLNDFYNNLFVYDKFNSVWNDHITPLNILIDKVSFKSIADKINIGLSTVNYSSFPIGSILYSLQYLVIYTITVKILNLIIYHLELNKNSMEVISDYDLLSIFIKDYSQMTANFKYRLSISNNSLESTKILIKHLAIINSKLQSQTISNISIQNILNTIQVINSNLLNYNKLMFNLSIPNINSNEIILDDSNLILSLNENSISNISNFNKSNILNSQTSSLLLSLSDKSETNLVQNSQTNISHECNFIYG